MERVGEVRSEQECVGVILGHHHLAAQLQVPMVRQRVRQGRFRIYQPDVFWLWCCCFGEQTGQALQLRSLRVGNGRRHQCGDQHPQARAFRNGRGNIARSGDLAVRQKHSLDHQVYNSLEFPRTDAYVTAFTFPLRRDPVTLAAHHAESQAGRYHVHQALLPNSTPFCRLFL